MDYIACVGFEGTGCDIELELLGSTEKAFKCKSPEFDGAFWMPKSSFTDDGSLTDYGMKLYSDKLKQSIKR